MQRQQTSIMQAPGLHNAETAGVHNASTRLRYADTAGVHNTSTRHNSDSGHKIASSVSTYVREKACMVGRHKATDHDIHVKMV
jgi:hypothetical protein